MQKIVLFMMTSLDGMFEGEKHDLSWHNVDEEFNEFAIEQTANVDTLLFGRRTYELMESFWPTEEARRTDPIVAQQMNTTPKMVFSKTLSEVKETEYWKNVSLRPEINIAEIKELKKTAKKDIAVYGSNNLAVHLMELGLLDEARIMVNPVAIGKGTPLFKGIKKPVKFDLAKSKMFKNGNVLLYYQVRVVEEV